MMPYYCSVIGVVAWLYFSFILNFCYVYAENYPEVRYTNIGGIKRCLAADSVYERIRDISFKRCLQECLARPHCKAVNYWTRRLFCEIADTDSGPTVGIADGSCLYVQRGDILGSPEISDNCTTCPDYSKCDGEGNCTILGCPRLSVENGIIYGNIRTVGAKAKVVCTHGATSGPDTIQTICQSDGSWSTTIICRNYCEATTPTKPKSTRVYNSVASGAMATYTCNVGYAVHVSGLNTGMATHTVTCNSTAETWAGLDFTCDSGCPLRDNSTYVQVSGMTVKVCMNTKDWLAASLDCQQVGSLLRIDTVAKHADIQTYLNNQPALSGHDLWIQGQCVYMHISGQWQWVFNNLDPMPTDANLWYDNDCSSWCALLRGDQNFRFDDRYCGSGYPYICEIP